MICEVWGEGGREGEVFRERERGRGASKRRM